MGPAAWAVNRTLVYLLLLAQPAREAGHRHGLELQPATNDPRLQNLLPLFFNLKPMPSRGHVVKCDIETVGVDLDTVPLDDVLTFREENRDDHQRYMRDLRVFALQLSIADDQDQKRLLADRRAELEEEARELRARATRAWKSGKKLTGFGIGLAGAAWSAATLNPVPAVLGALER